MEQPTPEHLQFISNLAHWIEGILFAAVATIALLRAWGYATWKGAQYLWPSLIVIAGLFLPVYILFQVGSSQFSASREFIFGDPQQREHVSMAVLLILAGAAELIAEAKVVRAKIWKLIAPGALVAIGLLLFYHTEYGTQEAVAEAVTMHRYQGFSVILVGVFKAAEVLWQQSVKWLAYPWIIVLLITATLLIAYREPAGAYRSAGTEPESVATGGG